MITTKLTNKIMKLTHRIFFPALALMAILISGCSDKKSYADLLKDESQAVNIFLSDNRVILDIPADSVFEVGENAPYYRLEPDGNVYMQVLDNGNGVKVKDNAQVFFRFTRYNLYDYQNTGQLGNGAGNSIDTSAGTASFRFNNTTLSSSTQWGQGVQMPLKFLSYDCHVRILIKSQYGVYSEISNVIPYLYDVRYFKSISE